MNESKKPKIILEKTYNQGKTYKLCDGREMITDWILLSWLTPDGEKITSWNWRGSDCERRCKRRLELIAEACDFELIETFKELKNAKQKA